MQIRPPDQRGMMGLDDSSSMKLGERPYQRTLHRAQLSHPIERNERVPDLIGGFGEKLVSVRTPSTRIFRGGSKAWDALRAGGRAPPLRSVDRGCPRSSPCMGCRTRRRPPRHRRAGRQPPGKSPLAALRVYENQRPYSPSGAAIGLGLIAAETMGARQVRPRLAPGHSATERDILKPS
jgi:hypothetical protein